VADRHEKEADMGSTDFHSDWVSEVTAVAAGGGILTFALFPLAVPMLLLTIAAALPLALPLIAAAALGAVLKGAWLGVRAAGRGIRRLAHGPGHPDVTRAQAA
jgi:hypothetical protein